jgi:hypothetical protein
VAERHGRQRNLKQGVGEGHGANGGIDGFNVTIVQRNI